MNITIGSKVFDGEKNAYTLTEVLGSGGFGVVYKAIKDCDNSTVAVKTFSSDFASEESMLSFQKELQQSLLIKSENVIDYYYTHDGRTFDNLPPYIIMEYADGGSLAEILESHRKAQDPIAIQTALDMCIQLCTGMKAVNQFLIHRDIKPENILICNGKLKISDFGLSKIATDATKTLTFKGGGTAKYSAPEVWNNQHSTLQVDIYSMGIVFYEIITLKYPYSISKNADLAKYRDAHLYQALNKAPLMNSKIGASIVSTIIKMTEKPTQVRYSNWDDIISAFSTAEDISLVDKALNSAIERALTNRNAYDISRQEAQLSAEKEAEEKRNYCQLVYSQLKHTVLQPIIDFIEQYNQKYPGAAKFQFHDAKDITTYRTFSHNINTPSGNHINIETEIIFKDNFKRKVNDPFAGSYETTYVPLCRNKEIMAWSCVSDSEGIGFNLLLLKSPSSMYGDWFIMRNKNSGLGRSRRAEPFGFEIRELPKEIDLINVTHIYTSEVIPFSREALYAYMGDHVTLY